MTGERPFRFPARSIWLACTLHPLLRPSCCTGSTVFHGLLPGLLAAFLSTPGGTLYPFFSSSPLYVAPFCQCKEPYTGKGRLERGDGQVRNARASQASAATVINLAGAGAAQDVAGKPRYWELLSCVREEHAGATSAGDGGQGMQEWRCSGSASLMLTELVALAWLCWCMGWAVESVCCGWAAAACLYGRGWGVACWWPAAGGCVPSWGCGMGSWVWVTAGDVTRQQSQVRLRMIGEGGWVAAVKKWEARDGG